MRRLQTLTLAALGVLLCNVLPAQNVGINASGAAPNVSAILDLDVSAVAGTKKGLLIPRVTTAERTAIPTPATGLLVYDSSLNQFWYYNGVAWTPLGVAGWALTGNTLVGTEFMGSINAQPVRFFSSNVERMRINANGEVVAGAIASPLVGDLLCAVSNVTNPWAVNGYSLVNGAGVYGLMQTGNPNNWGAVQGEYYGTNTGQGVRGIYFGTSVSNVRAGVLGQVGAPAATNGGAGVSGFNATAAGNQHMGVLGQYNGAAFGLGVAGIGYLGGILAGNFDVGVFGSVGSAGAFSGYFLGNHVIVGTKSASVPTSQGNQLLYVTESPEVWFEDLGRGQLVNGETTIALDPLFLETVAIDADHPMHVFVQLEGDCNGVFVNTGTGTFTVKELSGGTSSASFSYRVMAKRRNYEDHRFGSDPFWGAGDTRSLFDYVPPTPVNYELGVKYRQEMRASGKVQRLPAGSITYEELQRETQRQGAARPLSEP